MLSSFWISVFYLIKVSGFGTNKDSVASELETTVFDLFLILKLLAFK